MPRLDAAAVCAPGTEDFCHRELAGLGIKPKSTGPGIVEFSPTPRQLYASLVWLRTSTRVLVRLGTFRATTFEHLEMRVGELDWGQWLGDGVGTQFRVSSTKSRLIHTGAIAERFERVVGAPAGDGPVQPFVVRADRDRFTVSIDLAGAGFHHRTWRQEPMAAPLRPNLAAAAVLAAGWDGRGPIVDPFCGSGTLAIEAALIQLGLPPDLGRVDQLADSPFSQSPTFAPGTWASVVGEVRAKVAELRAVAPEATTAVLMSDRDQAAVEAAGANAERAGLTAAFGVDLRTEVQVVSHLGAAEGPGLVVANPPYGIRLDQGRLEPLYRRFGAVVRERRPGHDLLLVCPDRGLARQVDRRLRPVAGFGHGGRSVSVFSRRGAGT